MDDMKTLKEAVADYLRTAEGFSGARVLTAHPALWRESPVRGAAVAVGVAEVEAAPGGLGGYWGAGERGVLNGTGAQVTLRFDLYAPPDRGGDGPQALYEALCDSLMLRQNPFSAQKLWCGEVSYDGRAGAWHLSAGALLRVALVRRESGVAVEAFRLEKKKDNKEEFH